VTADTLWGPLSVMNSLIEHTGKKVRVVLTTSGASRISGTLRGAYADGLLLDVADPANGRVTSTVVLASSIATIEVVG